MCIGIVGRVVRTVDGQPNVAEVDVRGALRRVNTALVADGTPLQPGTYVLINVGMAVEVVPEQDAVEHNRMLDELEASFSGPVETPLEEGEAG